MSRKKRKGDILDDLLGIKEGESGSDMGELGDLIYRRGEPSPKKSVSGEGSGNKKKVTHYLSEKVSVELSEAKAKIKVMVPPEVKSQVSMSRIVEYALKAILDELDEKGNDSTLVREIMKNSGRYSDEKEREE